MREHGHTPRRSLRPPVRFAWTVAAMLATTGALAGDHHVLVDLDGDGNANACPSPAHRTHYSTDTTPCGSAFDIDGDGTDETLHCRLQDALDAAVGPGDTVEIHEGTHNDAGPLAKVGWICNGVTEFTNAEVLAVVRDCPSCTQESHRRHVRGAVMLGATDARDRVILDPNRGVATTAVALGQTGNDNVRWVTLAGFKIADVNYHATCDSASLNYLGTIVQKGNADYLEITNVRSDPASFNSPGECSRFASEEGIVFISGIPAKDEDVDNVRIHGNVTNACGFFGVKRGTGDATVANYDNWHIDANDVTCNGTFGDNCWEYKGFSGKLVISNNIFRSVGVAGSGNSGKTRKSKGEFWLFNNVWTGKPERCWTTHQQDTWTAMYIFNNTVRDFDGNHCFANGGNVRVFNNSVLKDPAKPAGQVHMMTSFTADSVHGNNHFWGQHSVGYTNASWDPTGDRGNHVCSDSETCGSNATAADCDKNASTCGPFDAGTSATAPYKITDTNSILIDRGTSDPAGQGPNKCSIAMWPGYTVDCTVDREGQDRTSAGFSWDIGADEYDQATPPVAPGDVKNARRTDRR